jgi:hypothetical protein
MTKGSEIEHFSPIATFWFPGSAWESRELQALPADRMQRITGGGEAGAWESAVIQTAISEKCRNWLFCCRVVLKFQPQGSRD